MHSLSDFVSQNVIIQCDVMQYMRWEKKIKISQDWNEIFDSCKDQSL